MTWTDEQKEAARVTCKEWLGTPFKSRLRMKGVGVDCINFVAAVLIGAGLIPNFDMPFYLDTIGGHGAPEIMSTNLDQALFVERIESTEPFQFGDIVVFDAVLSTNHVGIIIDDKIWHSLSRRTVSNSLIADWQKHFRLFMRLTAPGFKTLPSDMTL